MAITAFKMGLHPDSALCSSLTRRPPKTVWSLMKKVEEYCKVEDDALWVKVGHKAKKMAPPKIVQPINSVPHGALNHGIELNETKDEICADQMTNVHIELMNNFKWIVGT
ncbi:hypothetical protein CsSME_00032759 [Camellia sinensis var. sinensis]